MNIINADVVFLVMLGSAIWTSIQLAQRSLQPRTAGRTASLGVATATEGLICGLVWFATVAITAGGSILVALTQSLFVGLIWAGFGFVARLPFQQPARATR